MYLNIVKSSFNQPLNSTIHYRFFCGRSFRNGKRFVSFRSGDIWLNVQWMYFVWLNVLPSSGVYFYKTARNFEASSSQPQGLIINSNCYFPSITGQPCVFMWPECRKSSKVHSYEQHVQFLSHHVILQICERAFGLLDRTFNGKYSNSKFYNFSGYLNVNDILLLIPTDYTT